VVVSVVTDATRFIVEKDGWGVGIGGSFAFVVLWEQFG
ncbi:hypothetical protein A2U01_0109648, partial [Trifolium medium]|nr:hypothetical protein [Trifolium medium]